MAKTLYKYDTASNKFVWFTTWDRALRNYYSNDPAFVPDPVAGNEFNTNVSFTSRKPGMVNVDWGDGTKEQFPMTKVRGKGIYKIIFRSLDIEWRKNPDSSVWWFLKEDGSQYIPVPNHVYADGRKDVERAVSISFTCEIYDAYIEVCKMTSFPVVDLPGIESFAISNAAYINDGIPFDKLSRATKLSNLSLTFIGPRIKGFPKAIANKKELTSLHLKNSLDLKDIESSGIREIRNLKKLESLSLASCLLDRYVKEFNELPYLRYLDISPGDSSMWNYIDVNSCPSFDEVSAINPSIRDYYINAWMEGERRTEWNEANMSGKGLDHIQYFNVEHSHRLRVDRLPDYLKEMRSLNRFDFGNNTYTVKRIDDFINSFYDLMMGWEHITMSQTAADGKRNQFYGLTIYTYNTKYPNEASRPSGEERAPDGFVKGQSDGNPATPMEKIYVLKNNYAQRWAIKPA